MDQLFVNVARKIEVGGYTAKSEICLWGICKAITELLTQKPHYWPVLWNSDCWNPVRKIKQTFYTKGFPLKATFIRQPAKQTNSYNKQQKQNLLGHPHCDVSGPGLTTALVSIRRVRFTHRGIIWFTLHVKPPQSWIQFLKAQKNHNALPESTSGTMISYPGRREQLFRSFWDHTSMHEVKFEPLTITQ